MSKDEKGNEAKELPVLVDEEKLRAALRKKCRVEQPTGHKCKDVSCDNCFSMKDMLFGARVLQEELGVVAVAEIPPMGCSAHDDSRASCEYWDAYDGRCGLCHGRPKDGALLVRTGEI